MPDTTIHSPHDRFFRRIFSEPEVAADFLQPVLPARIAPQIAWPSLSLTSSRFVDSDLRVSESDLLFEAERLGDGTPVRIFLMLEHQSYPDRWMSHRLLRYCDHLWTEDRKRGAKHLPLVAPVVFYQGRRPWNAPTHLADLFAESFRGCPGVPDFEFTLVDQTIIGPEEVIGEYRSQLAQLVMMAVFQPARKAATPEALAKRAALVERITAVAIALEARWGKERLDAYLTYAASEAQRDIVDSLGDHMQQEGSSAGERLLTFAESYRAEGHEQGRAEGEQQATLRVADRLLDTGVGWDIIEKATGLNEASFLALKAELATA